MAYTFKNPSVDLKLRETPNAAEAPDKEAAEECLPEGYGIRLHHWHELRKAILHALLPHGPARSAVVSAIDDLQNRLGVRL